MKIERIGVVGAGQMGNGIAHVAALAGVRRGLYGRGRGARRAGYRRRSARTWPAQVAKGVIAADADGRCAGPDHGWHRPRRSRRLAISSSRPSSRDFEVKARLFAAARRDLGTGGNPGAVTRRRSRSRSSPPRRSVPSRCHRHALHEPGAGHEARRGHSRHRDRRRDLPDGRGARRRHGEDAGRGQRLSRLRRQPGADADDQRGDLSPSTKGSARREAVDTVMKLGMNHPMGPLTLADFIGLDTCLAILRVLHDGLGDPKYRPVPAAASRWSTPAGWAEDRAAASTRTERIALDDGSDSTFSDRVRHFQSDGRGRQRRRSANVRSRVEPRRSLAGGALRRAGGER